MRNRSISLFIAALTVLGGCSLAPDYQQPAMPTPSSWDGTPAGVPTSGERVAAEISWQEFVTDQKMQSVIELALANNRDLRSAALMVDRARAVYRIQRSELYPDVGVTAGAEKYRLPADLSTTGRAQTVEQYSVNLGTAAWELDFFGRIKNLKDSALEQYLATEEAHTATRISMVSAVASAYLSLAADTEALELAGATLETQQSTFDLIRKTRDIGMGSDLELRQAQSQVEAARVEQARLAGLVAVDRNALALLVGTPIPEDLLPVALGDESALSSVPTGMSSEILLARPDILAAEHQLKATNANIGAARAAFFPRIALTASGGTMSGELSGLFESGSGTWSFAPQINIPIFSGGALRAGLEAAEVDRELAVASYEKAIQVAFREVSDSLAQQSTLLEQTRAQGELVKALGSTLELARARYEAGLDSYLNVLVAERSLYSTRHGLISVRLADEVNQITLFKALGGGARRPSENEENGAGDA